MSVVRVRSASARDAGRLGSLLDELGYPSTSERLVGALAGAQTDMGDVVVAEEDDGDIIGFASYQLVYFFEDAAPRCRLTAIVVDRAAWRTGAGNLLLREIERIAVQAACTAIEATSRRSAERSAAHSFYQDVGFVDEATCVFFTKRLRTKTDSNEAVASPAGELWRSSGRSIRFI